MIEEATVSAPKSFSFEDVNHWVHIDSPEYEELQWNSLGMAQHIDGLQARIKALEKGLEAVEVLIDNSDGVAGLHQNGEIAPWEELREGGQFESWLLDFDAAIQMMQERCK